MAALRALVAAAAVAVAAAASPSRTSSATASATPSQHTPTTTPSPSPTASAFPVLVAENTWAVIDTSATSTTGSALIPTTDLLYRDQTSGDLYLQLQSITPCNATANPAFGGCPFGAVADLYAAWYSEGAQDSSFGYYPNVASEGTQHPSNPGSLANNDYITYYRYVKLIQNMTTGSVAIDLWDALGAISIVNNVAYGLNSWGVYVAGPFYPYATTESCIGEPASYGNVDLTGTPFKVDITSFGIYGLSTQGSVIQFPDGNGQVVTMVAGGGCGMAGPIYSKLYRNTSAVNNDAPWVVPEPMAPTKRNLPLDVLLVPIPSQTATATASGTGSASATVTASPSVTTTASGSITGTASSSVTRTASSSVSGTPSGSITGTASGSVTRTSSASATGTASASRTTTASPSNTRTSSASRTGTASASRTRSASPSNTRTSSSSRTGTASASVTVTSTRSATPTASSTPSTQLSATSTRSPAAAASKSGCEATKTAAATKSPAASKSGCAASKTPGATATPKSTQRCRSVYGKSGGHLRALFDWGDGLDNC